MRISLLWFICLTWLLCRVRLCLWMRLHACESLFFSLVACVLVRVRAHMLVLILVLVLTLPCADRYPYVSHDSHLICNTSVALFMGLLWSLLLCWLWRNLLNLNIFRFVVYPSYIVQHKGVMSDNGLGWTWQCNIFGDYILVHSLSHFTSERI